MVGCTPEPAATAENAVAEATKDKRYLLWEPKPAPNCRAKDPEDRPRRWYPRRRLAELVLSLGNGTLGSNAFGRTDIERIQLSEKKPSPMKAFTASVASPIPPSSFSSSTRRKSRIIAESFA
jgi:hypothetical protein